MKDRWQELVGWPRHDWLIGPPTTPTPHIPNACSGWNSLITFINTNTSTNMNIKLYKFKKVDVPIPDHSCIYLDWYYDNGATCFH